MWLMLVLLVAVAADDPEIHMNTPQIITHWGYPVEEVPVTTEDGYILTMHRIPHGKSGPSAGPRPVIFMQHGLLCSSSNFVANLPEESAGFLFADAGYDVWLGNMRGNTYGREHTHLSTKDKRFWEFSWDEMVRYDLPAMIDRVLLETNQTSLYYMGHSQGTLTMFSRLAVDPNFAFKIKSFFALAPVGTVKYIQGFVKFIEKFLGAFDIFYDIFGTGEFLPSNWIMKMVAEDLCEKDDIASGACDGLIYLIAGPETDQFNTTRAAVYAAHTPAGTSTQNFMHWAQMASKGTCSMFDYGSAKRNEEHYGHSSPPVYNFSEIKDVPIYLYWSENDWLADERDIEQFLLPNLNPSTVKGNFHLPEYNHFDFVWGLNATRDIYRPIIEMLKNVE